MPRPAFRHGRRSRRGHPSLHVSIRTPRAQKTRWPPGAPHSAFPALGKQHGKVGLMALLTTFQQLHDGCTPPPSAASFVTMSNANVYTRVAWTPAASTSPGAEILGLAQRTGSEPQRVHCVRGGAGTPQPVGRTYAKWDSCRLPRLAYTTENSSPKTQLHTWGRRSPPTSQMTGNGDRSKAASTRLPLTLQTSCRARMKCSRSPSDLHVKARSSRPRVSPDQGEAVGGAGVLKAGGWEGRHQP